MLDFKFICLDTENPNSLFDFTLAPDLLYYSYIPILFTSLIFGLIIIRNRSSGFTLHHKIFFFLTLAFSLHISNELIQWTVVPASIMYFAWSLVPLYHTLIALLVLYFCYVYVFKKDAPRIYKILSAIVVVPIIVFLPTSLNINGFDIVNCDALNGVLWKYVLTLKIFVIVILLGMVIKEFFNYHTLNIIIYLASLLFLVIFFGAEQVGYYTYEFEFNLIGPIGMLVFLTLITYLIVRFQAFNIKLIATQALVFGLLFLIVSQFFFIESKVNMLLNTLNFILLTIGGLILIKSVQKEIRQREEIQKLAKGLEKANNRLRELDKQKSEFVSIASHQLRSPLTAMRGYASMLIEESFGSVNEKQKEILSHIQDSSKMMASSIEDYLSISRIESGNMKYEYSDFNLRELTEQLVEGLQVDATNAGLLLLFKSEMTAQGIVHADKGKVYQIIHNLLNNSIKYTPKGTVTVFINDDTEKKTINVQIIDTGIGMNQATISKLFEKFSRAQNANEVNIKGTGLGLYVARALARAMNGEVTATSEGEGKGSVFTFTIPYVM